MAVPAGPTEQRYTGNGVSTIFTVPFLVIQASDLAVYIDGVELTSGYTQSNVGNPTSTVTFSTAPVLNSQIVLALEVPFERLNDYQENGDLLAKTVNNDYDRIWQALKQLLRYAGRALTLGRFDVDGQGWYRAKGNGIRGLANPVETQDAATKGSVEAYVAEVLATGQGPLNNAANIAYAYPDNVVRTVQTLSNKSDPTLGAAGIGYRGRSVGAKLSERIDVTDFWQVGDSSWSDAIDRCIAIAESASSTTTGPAYTVPTIWFPRSFDPAGTYGILRPIRARHALQFDGDNARIVTLPGFVGATLPLAAGGTEVNRSMMIFLNGNKGAQASLTDVVRWKAKVGRGITLDCQGIANCGIYTERMLYSSYNCEIQFALQDGIQIGPSSWGINLDELIVENAARFSIHLLTHSAANGGSMNNMRLWGEFLTSQAHMVFDLDAEANGLKITGGFAEKADYGVIISGGNGPIEVSSMDFEQCTYNVVRAVGNPATQKVGPISINSCFLHSINAAKVYADHATINVQGCRMYPGTVDFETDGLGRGIINAKENRYMNADTVGIGAGIAMSLEQNDGLTKLCSNYLAHKSNAFFAAYNMKNFQFRDAPNLQSSGFNFFTNYVGGASGQYVSRSDWWISEYQHVTAPGVLNKVIGVRLANDSGQNSFQPMSNNATTCGAPGASWAGGSTQVAFTVVSDERQKQQLQEISNVERRVAVKCRALLGLKYKLNDQVEKLGDKAKWHFGTSAQRVIGAFESEGLDAMEYSVVEYHEWGDVEPVLDADGAVTIPGQPAGNVYTVNYEELQAFVLSVI